MLRLLSLALLLCASSIFAHHLDDLDHAVIEGRLTDANGGAIPAAAVTLKQINTGQQRRAVSKADGSFRFSALLPSVYELRIVAQGFQTVVYQDVQTSAGQTLRRDFALNPAQVAEELTISATAGETQVDTTRTIVGGTLNRAHVDELPVETRNVFDLIYLLPGVGAPAFTDRDLAEGDRKDSFGRTPEESGMFSLNGGTAFSNNLTIEGLDNNDDRSARERFVPTMDAVEEVQIVTNQFSAEYGRASGGRINLRLRGGANQWRGRGFYYFRDESLNANAYRRNADPARGFRLPFQNHNPGASFGGPLKKDKLFFFATYEYDNVYDRADIAALVPVAANPAFALPQPNGANLGFTAKDRTGKSIVVNDGAAVGLYDERITTPRRAHTLQWRTDAHFTGTHSAFGLLTLARNRDERGFPGERRTLDTLRATGRNSVGLAFGDDFIFSPRLVNNARFQFSRLLPHDAPPGDQPVVLIDIDDPRDVIGDTSDNALTRTGSLLAGSSNTGGLERREMRWQAQDTLSYSRGGHNVRAGVDVQAIRSRFVDLSDASGTFRFASVGDFLANKPARYEHRFNTTSELRNTYAGVFAQDDWRVRRQLTFSFGVRWDNETILKDRNNIGPRLAVAWAPRGSHRMAVRAGYGIFYNRALLRTLDDYTLTSNALLVDTNNAAAARLLTELRFPAVLAANDARVMQLGVREAGFLRRLGKDFRIPESYQASLGIERELRRGTKLEVSYVFNRGAHLWREINANAARLPAGFRDFAAYLTARDFDNRVNTQTGLRPITTTGNADNVRFDLSTTTSRTFTEAGRSFVLFGLNNPSTSNAAGSYRSALAALRNLRPDPALTQVEELQALGNSAYHGVSVEVLQRLSKRGSLRASYTLSKLIDDGTLNTSSPLVVGDFRRERALSALDTRHRVVLSSYYQLPNWLARLTLAGTLQFSSARPFNISLGSSGNDRNLDDVNTDRPNFSGNSEVLKWRRANEPLANGVAEALTLPTLGTSGNLPRNAGRGPNTYTLNLRLAREFQVAEKRRLTWQLEAFNPLNATVFSFGAEFVNFNPSSLGNFMVPPRTVKPRTLRLGLRFEF
ncbi:MAG: TonB-dependent receptor [Acidobacteria bacterium]|nr:TonB-dependent receptor [Acidobacteriota bacterium]MBI3427597.1 TonB-dependent receptor [Acidobacteriota bacterium]